MCVYAQGWEHLSRIVSTPTPFVYKHLVSSLMFLFVFTFPFGYVSTISWAVIPAAMVMAMGFYGVGQVTHELENPLGWDENDIDLTGFLNDLDVSLAAIHESVFGPDPPANQPITFGIPVSSHVGALSKPAGAGSGDFFIPALASAVISPSHAAITVNTDVVLSDYVTTPSPGHRYIDGASRRSSVQSVYGRDRLAGGMSPTMDNTGSNSGGTSPSAVSRKGSFIARGHRDNHTTHRHVLEAVLSVSQDPGE